MGSGTTKLNLFHRFSIKGLFRRQMQLATLDYMDPLDGINGDNSN